MAGLLYIVATPIGNLEDVTLRALRVLKEVDLIAAEDTRHTEILLHHYDIRTPVTSYHEHNERSKAQTLIERLRRGEQLALVCDAGTPAISDPGYRLVVEAIGAGITVVPLPGASALTAALSAAGLPTNRFIFDGFLPAKKTERRRRIEAMKQESRTLVFYEAPHRLKETLDDLEELLGERQLAIGREISKLHEEFWRGTVSELRSQIDEQTVKGEITLVVQGAIGQPPVSEEELIREIDCLAQDGMRVKEIAELVGEHRGIAKRDVYRLALRRKKPK